MYSIIYRSVAAPNFSKFDIYQMLSKARSFNNDNDITGCLLYHNNEFVQLLEGEKEKINSLFDNIKKDKRHEKIQTLDEMEIAERIFIDWDMAYHDFSDNNTSVPHEKMRQIDAIFDKSGAFTKPSRLSMDFFKNVNQILFKKS